MAKKSKKASGQEHKMQEHLDEIKGDLEELRSKLGMAKRGDFSQLTAEAAKKLGDTSSEIIKSASDVVERALKMAQFAAIGAVEGARKALKEEAKETKQKRKKS